ncbi:NADPH-dependent FMN reductase [Halobaculum sp. P14]|uniref:NADPH-dependent FMN reductase n=1 Tax=Halobaculum sp. P14 TaxID=3421638 RepID=UPI003EC06533
MTDSPRVVAVCGSRRDGSYSKTILRYALDAAADAGADTDFIDLGDPSLDVPLYHPDVDAAEAGDVAALLERVRAADGVLLASPVYHGSYSSTFRSFHDWCSHDEYEDTVVGLFVVAGGGSFEATLEHMRATVRGVHGWVPPLQVGVRNASDKFDDRDDPDAGDGIGADSRYALSDDPTYDRTVTLGRRVAHYAATKAPFLDTPE